MPIEPFIRCSDIANSLDFYTNVLDFEVIQAPDSNTESFMSRYCLLKRDGYLVHLSSHSSDGEFGNVVYIRVDDIDVLFQTFTENGLNTDDSDNYPSLRIPPIEQTWGMKEFSITDPDGNKMIFGHQIA